MFMQDIPQVKFKSQKRKKNNSVKREDITRFTFVKLLKCVWWIIIVYVLPLAQLVMNKQPTFYVQVFGIITLFSL